MVTGDVGGEGSQCDQLNSSHFAQAPFRDLGNLSSLCLKILYT